ncbi:hypothetical protein ABZZ44_00255 [Streptomyces sp. NPDC006460]|uniref:hypothetical protein n=1 Tax=Streptomyces sp. NPDC006460 TaxID=3154304 RepID=UPI0033AE9020
MTAQPTWRMTREQVIPLVERLGAPDTPEEESSTILASLEQGLVCPPILNFAYWDFDPELTPEKGGRQSPDLQAIAL